MKIFSKKYDLMAFLSPFISEKSIGFVPTMGALHQGHLSLIKRSASENDLTIVSIFVNPTQFNNAEDLQKYPRTLQKDIDLIENFNPNIVIFAPEIQEMYGENVASETFNFNGLDRLMEGASRPGHFDGVGTIVKKLFEIVQPTKAYFGEKDFQQILIIETMVQQFQLPVTIVRCPIVREENGLAMSSRNQRLSATAKKKAGIIFESLQIAKHLFSEKSISEIQTEIELFFSKNPDFQLEYFTIANATTLLPVSEKLPNQTYRGFIAVYVEGVRLIDTMEF